MKKIILTLTIALASAYGYSQQTDSRLLKVYSESELTRIKQEDPLKYDALVYGIKNATYTTKLPTQKEETKNLPSIKLPKGDYNYVSLGLRIEDDAQYFRVENTDLMLVVKASQILKYELQQNVKK